LVVCVVREWCALTRWTLTLTLTLALVMVRASPDHNPTPVERVPHSPAYALESSPSEGSEGEACLHSCNVLVSCGGVLRVKRVRLAARRVDTSNTTHWHARSAVRCAVCAELVPRYRVDAAGHTAARRLPRSSVLALALLFGGRVRVRGMVRVRVMVTCRFRVRA